MTFIVGKEGSHMTNEEKCSVIKNLPLETIIDFAAKKLPENSKLLINEKLTTIKK